MGGERGGERPSELALALGFGGGGHGGKGGFDFGDGGKVGGDFGRKVLADPVFGHADGLPGGFKRPLDHRVVLGLADQKSDGRFVGRLLQKMVHGGDVEPELAEMFGLELRRFHFHDDVAVEVHVEEQQVGEFLLRADLKPVFTSDEHKALPEFEKESFDVRQERVLELLFAVAGREGDEVEGVGVLRDFLRQVAFAFRKTGREIRERLALPLVQFRVEEVQKNRTAPAVCHGLPDIEKRGFRIRPELVDDGDVVSPRNGED